MIMTGGGVDTEDETDFKDLKLKLNINNIDIMKGNNLLELVKLSMHCASSSGLSYYEKSHSVQTTSELI